MSSIFFIDDEENVLNSLKRSFRNMDFESYYFSNGRDALEKLKEVKPNVVVCDVLMPDMNGFEVLKEFENISPSTVRVMLTGYADVTTILHAMNSGDVYRFITKPWKIQEEAVKILMDSIKYSEFLSGFYSP